MKLAMTTDGALGTAFLRSAYLAAGMFLIAFLPAWAVTDDLKGPLIAGGMTALGALGFRGLGEGLFDKHRNATGDLRSADVGQPDACQEQFNQQVVATIRDMWVSTLDESGRAYHEDMFRERLAALDAFAFPVDGDGSLGPPL